MSLDACRLVSTRFEKPKGCMSIAQCDGSGCGGAAAGEALDCSRASACGGGQIKCACCKGGGGGGTIGPANGLLTPDAYPESH